jgi:hypothetical protein
MSKTQATQRPSFEADLDALQRQAEEMWRRAFHHEYRAKLGERCAIMEAMEAVGLRLQECADECRPTKSE